jgi:hypothetical protein
MFSFSCGLWFRKKTIMVMVKKTPAVIGWFFRGELEVKILKEE